MDIPDIKLGEKLICPVCNKEFKATEDTNYIVKDGFVCSWKCFLNKVNETQEDKKIIEVRQNAKLS